MFDRLILTEPESAQIKNRKTYFLVSSLVLSVGLSVALVMSLFAVDLDLGTDSFELTELIAPVEPPPDEPKMPEPAPAPRQQRQAAPTSAPKVPTRQAVVARLDESPRETPPVVSTVQNTQKERPASRYFEVGKFDSDPASSSVSSGRGTGDSTTGTGESTGLATGGETVAVVEKEAPPPPPVKKDPPAPPKPPVIRSMGVINGKATDLPKPIYSPAAKAVNAQGQVSVKVLINENGVVVSADAVSGHPLLRSAAESAARRARFTPTVLSGEAIKISGTIVYNFTT
jgi:TonB family protein